MPRIIEEENVEISIGKNQISFKLENINFIAQLLSGSEDFPEYEKVIPSEDKLKIAQIETDKFLSILKRISLLTSERNNRVKLSFGKNVLVVSAVSPDIGEAQEKIEIGYDGEEQSFSFPPAHISEFLQKVKSEKIIFGFTNERKPVLLRPEDETEFVYVTMPLKE